MPATVCLGDEDPLAVRVQNFIVTPSTGPVVHIEVANFGNENYQGVLTAKFPAGWQVTPSQQPVELGPGQKKKLPFAIERGSDVAANYYPVSVTLRGSGRKIVREQQVLCASTPYFKPKVDGSLTEWDDAIPISLMEGGRRTVVRSYWNRRQFCLAVEVEERELIGVEKSSPEMGMDAIQFALAPAGSVTGGADGTRAVRYEFLVADSASSVGRGACYQLAKPGDDLARCGERRPLKSLVFREAEAVVKRTGQITHYEVAIPFAAMPALRPTPGREYNFSLLVHDAAGTGLRDLGVLMNLTNRDRRPGAWASWEHVRWNGIVPFDNKIEFGFCSSIH